MTTQDPGLGFRPSPAATPPELAELERRISNAISAVNELGNAHAKAIAARDAAAARAKEWADIAYEMWTLIVNSVHDGHGNTAASARWEAHKKDLRDRLHAALDTMPEDVKL